MQFEFPIDEFAILDEKTRKDYLKALGSDKDHLLVIYCGLTKCGHSHNGVWWTRQLGYTNVYRYHGGIKAWEQADNPFETTS